MKVAVIQASSQKDKNALLEACTRKALENTDAEVINFGIFNHETVIISYVETALLISLLLSSKAVDFVVTGCSSGQGMMLACNSLPGVNCGYISNPSEAFLFGRINAGNAIAYPLGLQFGWSGEIQLQDTLNRLFDGPFGTGYPAKDAQRQIRDTQMVKTINQFTKCDLITLFPMLDKAYVHSAMMRTQVVDYVLRYGQDEALKSMLKGYL